VGKLDIEAFAHIVAHDLSTPLRGLSIHLKLLQQQIEGGNTDVAERIDLLQQRLRRMDEMLRRIRAFSKASTGHSSGPADLREIVAGAWAGLDADGRLDVTGAGSVAASPLIVAAIVGEILGNAVEHHSGTPTITAHIGAATLTISDDGPGIPDVEAAMTMFAPSAATIQEGGGAGLAFAAHLAAEAGGSVTLSSSDKGTIATIVLPSAE
jgi:signal transduction histidine kinase